MVWPLGRGRNPGASPPKWGVRAGCEHQSVGWKAWVGGEGGVTAGTERQWGPRRGEGGRGAATGEGQEEALQARWETGFWTH